MVSDVIVAIISGRWRWRRDGRPQMAAAEVACPAVLYTPWQQHEDILNAMYTRDV